MAARRAGSDSLKPSISAAGPFGLRTEQISASGVFTSAVQSFQWGRASAYLPVDHQLDASNLLL